MDKAPNVYELSRAWFNWCFENPDLISPNHTALYFFAIEHCNRLGWKSKFGLPTSMAKEAIGIKSYNTYANTLRDIVEWGFIKLIEKSTNQYSSNIIALSKNVKATNKALDKAFIKHDTKQSESTIQSIDSIDKPITSIPDTNLQGTRTPPKKYDLVFPFHSESFMQKWEAWVLFRAEIKKPYQTFSEQQAALQFLGNHPEETAIEIIMQSIRNKWKDFFNIKDNGKQGNSNSGRQNAIDKQSSVHALVNQLRKSDQPDNGAFGT